MFTRYCQYDSVPKSDGEIFPQLVEHNTKKI